MTDTPPLASQDEVAAVGAALQATADASERLNRSMRSGPARPLGQAEARQITSALTAATRSIEYAVDFVDAGNAHHQERNQ